MGSIPGRVMPKHNGSVGANYLPSVRRLRRHMTEKMVNYEAKPHSLTSICGYCLSVLEVMLYLRYNRIRNLYRYVNPNTVLGL